MSRLSYIEESLRSLERFKGKSFAEFHSNPYNFRIAFYDLHRALEPAMDIGSHILSKDSRYKGIFLLRHSPPPR